MVDLCSITDVQAITQQTYSGSTTPTDAQVNLWITQVSGAIESWVGFSFSSQTATDEKQDGNGTEFIQVKNRPLIAVTSLVVDGKTLVANTDYWVEDSLGGLIELANMPCERVPGSTIGHQNIILTYTYGKTSIPPEVKEYCAIIVAMKALGSSSLVSSSGGSIKSYDDGDVSITYAGSLDDSLGLQSLINRYNELKILIPRKVPWIVGGKT